MRLTLTAAAVTADTTRRTLTGTVYRYGEVGHTSAGPLAVGQTMPVPPVGLMVTFEHDREIVRAHVAMVDNNGERLRIAARVVDGELGDQALAEATSRQRAAFSLDIEDAEVVDGVIVSGRWEAIGQVADPAFNSARIDSIAASNTTGGTPVLTDEQRARLDELLAQTELTPEEAQELQGLLTLAQTAAETAAGPAAAPAAASAATAAAPAEPAAAPAAQPVAASRPAVPGGVPAPARAAATTQPRRTGLQQVIHDLTAALSPSNTNRVQDVTAALNDITNTEHGGDMNQPQWVGELWSGLEYEPEWSDLFPEDVLTHYEGKGWRFTQKLEIQDYAGDKAAIPTGDVTTETVEWDAARMAVGVDVDRKFYDFPNEGMVENLVQQVRESWEIKKDAKLRAFALANAVAGTRTAAVTTANGDATVTAASGTFSAADVGATITGAGIPNGTTILSVTNSGSIEMTANATASATVTATIGAQAGTLLKAAARLSLILKRRRVGAASWIVVNDEDMFTLLDVAEKDIPAFLQLWGIEPGNFRSSADVPRGTVLGGARQSAKWRQLPGSPIRVSAQHLANGGVDEAFFGYWAIEEHHNSGIATVQFKQTA